MIKKTFRELLKIERDYPGTLKYIRRYENYVAHCIKRLREAGIIQENDRRVLEREAGQNETVDADVERAGSLPGELSRDSAHASFTITEAKVSSIHEEVFGDKVSGSAQFFRHGEKIHWVTPRTRKDEENVEKHYGRTLIHFPVRKEGKKRSGRRKASRSRDEAGQ